MAYTQPSSPLNCWEGYERVPGTSKFSKGSCRKVSSSNSPATKKQKGGGTTKTCLPASKIKSMSKEQRQKLVNAKQKSGAKGKYKSCLLYTSPSPRDKRQSRMPSSA